MKRTGKRQDSADTGTRHFRATYAGDMSGEVFIESDIDAARAYAETRAQKTGRQLLDLVEYPDFPSALFDDLLSE